MASVIAKSKHLATQTKLVLFKGLEQEFPCAKFFLGVDGAVIVEYMNADQERPRDSVDDGGNRGNEGLRDPSASSS